MSTNISALTTGTTVHADDYLVFVDIHDSVTMAPATSANKKAVPATVLAGMLGTTSGVLVANGSGVVTAAAGTDIPNLAASKITTGQLAAARGGTGVDSSAAANGSLLIGNGSGLALATITAGSNITVTNSAGGITIASTGGSGSTLTPTAVKTTSYTAAVGDLVPVDTTSGAVTVTLPTAPADKSQIEVKHVTQGSTNAVTVAAGGSDVFNKTGGNTTISLASLNRSALLQYKSSGSIWYVLDSDKGSLIASDLPTIPTLNVLANTTGGTAAPAGNTLSAIIDSAIGATQGGLIYRGASAWSPLAPGTAGQPLISGGSGANPSWGRPRTPIATITGAGTAVTNTTTATSVFAGSTVIGSLTIPANRLAVGSTIDIELFGTFGTSAGPVTLTTAITIGGSTVLTGVTASMGTSVTGKMWFIDRTRVIVSAIGASGSMSGVGQVVLLNTPSVGLGSATMTTGGSGTASTAVTLNTTAGLAIDVTVAWSEVSTSDTLQLLGGNIWIDG